MRRRRPLRYWSLLFGLLTACPGPAPEPECCDAGPTDAFVPEDSFAPEDSFVPEDAFMPEDAGSEISECSPEGFELWESAHRSLDLNAQLADCALAPTCDGEPCSLGECLRATTGVSDCAACVDREVECVASACRSACSGSSTSDRCRYCICEAGCFSALEECAGQTGGLCAACDADTERCPPYLLSPALIMTIAG